MHEIQMSEYVEMQWYAYLTLLRRYLPYSSEESQEIGWCLAPLLQA